jgi:hypothetical protein
MSFREVLSVTRFAFACAFARANGHSLGAVAPWLRAGDSGVSVITESKHEEAGVRDAECQPLAFGPARVIVIRTITRWSRRIASR